MVRIPLVAVGCATAIASALVTPAVGAAQVPLKLVTAETLKVSAKKGQDQATSTIFVLNEGKEQASVEVSFVAPPGTTVTANANAPVPGSSVAPVEVTFGGLNGLDKEIVGALAISGGSAPLARSVEITPAIDPTRDWPRDILFFSLVMALLLACISVGWVEKKANLKRLLTPAPGPKWSLDSWATTVTAAGAVLGTVLGALTFPDTPEQVSKDTLVSLNVFFGLLLVTGPFLLKALRRPSASPTDQEGGLWGTNLTVLLASCMILAAVVGEIATLGLLFSELLDGNAAWVAVTSAVLAEVVALFYFVTTIPRIVATDWTALAAEAKASEKEADRARMKKLARIVRRELEPYLVDDRSLIDSEPEASDDLIGDDAEWPSVRPRPSLSLP